MGGDTVLLAELEVFHTRPAQPTRRVALGHLALQVDPPPGFGGLLLGAVVARHIVGVDADLHRDIRSLIHEVAAGKRIVQPRLRYRFQVDRHGLAKSTHRLVGEDDELTFDFDSHGTDLAQVLGAVYAVERLALEYRTALAPMLDRATRWTGPIGPELIGQLAGVQAATLEAMADPRGWAMEVLGFDLTGSTPSRREVTKAFRARMREVHPDHGGAHGNAASAMRDLADARRILESRR